MHLFTLEQQESIRSLYDSGITPEIFGNYVDMLEKSRKIPSTPTSYRSDLPEPDWNKLGDTDSLNEPTVIPQPPPRSFPEENYQGMNKNSENGDISSQTKPEMSDEKPQTEETAPALPTTEPPVEDPKPETAATEEVAAAPATEENKEGEAKAEEKTEEKKPSRLKKRLTLKWGKNRDQAEQPKEPEAPADPRADVITWIAQQIPVAVHKVNHNVLDWAQKIAVEDESARQPLPGKDGQVTRNQFLSFLRDGDLLVKLANKLQPGAIEPAVAEEGADANKQKEVHSQNVAAFSKWAQETLGVEEGKSMTAGDLLEKGKAGYAPVFDTLWNLGLKAQEKFEKEGFDVDAIVNTVSNTVRTTILGQIVAFFRRNRRATTEEKTEEKPAEAEVNAAENQQVEEPAEKVEAVPESTPAVAAN